jgi:hypothetical protein
MAHSNYSIASAALGLALVLCSTAAHADTAQYYGRWTVSDDKPAFSAKGKFYKTIDMAPCGKDFCGVAVDEKNNCGPTLFRFLTTHAKDEELTGHGVWGSAKKKLIMGYATPQDEKAYMYLGLGADDMDLGGREGSDPIFDANYKIIGKAACKTN